MLTPMTTPPKPKTKPEVVTVNIKLPKAIHRKLRIYCVSQKPELVMADVITAALRAYL